MTPDSAQAGAAAETGTGCGCRRRDMDTLEARFGALMDAIAADPDRPDLARRMNLLTAAFREDRDELAKKMFVGALDEAEIERAYQRGRADERAAARVPAQRRGRHSAAGAPRPGWQRAALRVIPVGMLGLAAKILSAHRVLAPAALAAATVGTRRPPSRCSRPAPCRTTPAPRPLPPPASTPPPRWHRPPP